MRILDIKQMVGPWKCTRGHMLRILKAVLVSLKKTSLVYTDILVYTTSKNTLKYVPFCKQWPSYCR